MNILSSNSLCGSYWSASLNVKILFFPGPFVFGSTGDILSKLLELSPFIMPVNFPDCILFSKSRCSMVYLMVSCLVVSWNSQYLPWSLVPVLSPILLPFFLFSPTVGTLFWLPPPVTMVPRVKLGKRSCLKCLMFWYVGIFVAWFLAYGARLCFYVVDL